MFISGPAGTDSVTFFSLFYRSSDVNNQNRVFTEHHQDDYINQTHLTKTHLLKYIKPCPLRACCPQSPSLTENSWTSVRTQIFQQPVKCPQQALQGTFPPSAGGEFNCSSNISIQTLEKLLVVLAIKNIF